MPMRATTSLLAAAVLLAATAPAAAFDKVLLKDGRQVEGTILPSDDPEHVLLSIQGVEIPIPMALVDKTWIENLEGYVPKDKQEEEWLKKGYVRFEGSWMSKKRRDDELKKRAEADREYIKQAKAAQDWRNARTFETRHFAITSNLDEDTLARYTALLEGYYKYFVEFWGITLSPGDNKGKPRVFLYRNLEDFYNATGSRRGVLGYFFAPENVLHLAHHADDPDYGIAVLFHEGNHLLTHMIDTRFDYPTWMNEGMAEYYGTAHVDEKGKYHIGAQQDGRISALRRQRDRGEFRKLRDVLMREHAAFDAYDYAYAWSFIHYLMESDKYAKLFRGFFANLPQNKDIVVENVAISNYAGATVARPDLGSVVKAFEKRMGKSVEALEEEWLVHFEQAYGELKPMAYYKDARNSLFSPKQDGTHLLDARASFDKAVALGIRFAPCYRDFADLLRKGDEEGLLAPEATFGPDQEKAWEMIQVAIELDPVNPSHYLVAGNILVMDGPIQDLDRAQTLGDTAKALAGTRDLWTRVGYEVLMAKIEPAREKAREKAQREAEEAAADERNWHVAFYYVEGETPPDNLEDLSTSDLRELVSLGKVTGRDFVFQTWQAPDPETGEPTQGSDAWDLGWVPVSECPVFAEALAAAAAKAGGEN